MNPDDSTVDDTPPPLPQLHRSPSARRDPSPATPRYRLLTIHASGGMGRVWVGHDEVLGRRVAVKELRPELQGSDDIAARFLQEIQVTARLEHPGIVPIYDVAPAADRQPGYVMRFVEGKTLAEEVRAYHEARRRGAAERLGLVRLINAVVAVCQTVGFAHARSVLHRDLKPANILLGEFGEVVVLDWGLAKMMGGVGDPGGPTNTSGADRSSEAEQRSTATQAGQVLGTPAYMAPEQATGLMDRLDVRTDVFGLGAILYEVLTGVAPFAASKDVQHRPPPRPRALNPETAPALDAICRKALAAVPVERYPSAATLAADLQRWLADEAVSALPEAWPQRVGRWMRRHRTVVAAGLFVIFAGLLALGTTTVLVNEQRRRAEASLHTALDAVDSFLVKISEERLLYEPGMQHLRTELLATARRFGENFVRDSAGDPNRLADLARTLTLLGKSAALSGDAKQARADLERSRDLYRELARRAPDNPTIRTGLARCQLEIGKVARQLGGADPAAELLDAIALWEQEPVSADALRHLAIGATELGLYYVNARRWQEARAYLEQAVAVGERAVALDPDNWIHRNNLAVSLSSLAEWLKDHGQLELAKARLQTALDIRLGLLAKRLLNPMIEEGVAQSYNNFGNLLLREKKVADADRHFRAAFKHYLHLTHQNPGVPRYRRHLGAAHYNLSRVLWLTKKTAAVAELQHGVTLLETLHEDYPEPLTSFELARAQYNLGYYQQQLDQDEAALRWLQQTEQTARPLSEDPTVGAKAKLLLRDVFWTRAEIHAGRQRYRESLEAYATALTWDDGTATDELRTERDKIAKLAEK